MKRTREFYVGLFSLVSIVLFVLFTISLQDLDFFSNTNTYHVTFKSVNKLEPGASVLVHGVKEGVVSKIESVAGPQPVMVTLKLSDKVRLFDNAVISVSTAAVIGDTTVTIDSGSPGPGSDLMPPESQFEGKETIELMELAGDLGGDVRSVIAELQKSLVAINTILTDEKNQQATRELLAHMNSVTGEADQTFKTFNEELKPLIRKLHGTINRANTFLDKGSALSDQLSGDVAETRKSVVAAVDQWGRAGAGLEADIHATAESIQRIADKIDATLETNDEPLQESIQSLQAASASLERLLGGLERGEGTAGRIMTDPRPFDELRQAISALNRALTGGEGSIMPPVGPNGGGVQ